MTTSTRNRLLVIGLAVLVLGIILAFTFLGGDGSEPQEAVPSETPSEGLGVSSEADLPAMPPGLEPEDEPTEEQEGHTASLQMAELFSERYASYSNQGSYRNLRDLLPVMTLSFRAETQAFLDTVDASAPASQYEGYTAKKVSTEEIAFDASAGLAVHEVSLQQVRTGGTSEPEVLYPVLRVSLEQVGEEWKIDGAEWVR